MKKVNNDINDKLNEFEQGYYKGLAVGIVALFKQDQIKKPAEQIVNYEFFGIENRNELEVIDDLLNSCDNNKDDSVKLVTTFLSGNKVKLSKETLIKIIYEKGYYSVDYDDLPYHYQRIFSEKDFHFQLKKVINENRIKEFKSEISNIKIGIKTELDDNKILSNLNYTKEKLSDFRNYFESHKEALDTEDNESAIMGAMDIEYADDFN